MKISCADYTWPLLPHDRALKLIRLLDIEAVDFGLFGNEAQIRPEVVRQDIPTWCGILKERLAQAELGLADVFATPWSDFETMAVNNPDPQQREGAMAFFQDMLTVAHRLGAPGMTVLPGTRFGDETWDASIRRSAEGLKYWVEAAAGKGIALSVEAYMGSNVDTPEKLAYLLQLTPGLLLTLDYGHFTVHGFADAQIEPLLAYTRHLHCRGAAPGRLQVSFDDNTIDYRRVIARLKEAGYDGYVALEYVWTDWHGCNATENTCETIRFRDLVRSAIAEDIDPVPAEKYKGEGT
jgi:sugar phosphate isomerase/epimerase